MTTNSIQDIASSAALELARQKDEEIRKAISNHLKREDWTLEEVLPHVRKIPTFTHPAPCGTIKSEIYCFGDKPILEIEVAKVEGRKGKMKWTQNYRHLS